MRNSVIGLVANQLLDTGDQAHALQQRRAVSDVAGASEMIDHGRLLYRHFWDKIHRHALGMRLGKEEQGGLA